MYSECYNCGQMFEAWDPEDDLCQECLGEFDFETDEDDEDDWDNPFSLFDPYYAGDVPDPFDEKVKAKRRRFLRWPRRKLSPRQFTFKWSWLPIRLNRERQQI